MWLRLPLVSLVFIASIAAEASSDLQHLSEFLDRKCRQPIENSPQTRLACRWSTTVQKVVQFEQGRPLNAVHHAWVRSLRTALLDNQGDAFPISYFNYLDHIQALQIQSIYLLYKLQMNWKTENTSRFSKTVLQTLTARIPGGEVSQTLYRLRLRENLKEFIGWDLVPEADHEAEKALVQWLANPRHVRDLQRLLETEKRFLGVRGSLVTATVAESLPGTISTNPIEILYREDASRDFFLGLRSSRVARDWLIIYESPIDKTMLQEFAGWFLARFTPERLGNLTTCQWLKLVVEESMGMGGPLVEVVKDCEANVDIKRGINFWTSMGIGFEKPVPTLKRLNSRVERERPTLETARRWQVTQTSIWILATERLARGMEDEDIDAAFAINSAASLFERFSRGGESVDEYYERRMELMNE